MSDTINDPAQIEAAFERDQEAEDSRPAPLAGLSFAQADKAMRTAAKLGVSMADVAASMASASALLAPPDSCACFPGTCRGGEVINGRTAGGMRCRRSDTKAERDKVDERLALGLLRAEYGERAGYLAGRLEEIAGRLPSVPDLQADLRESAKLLRCLLIG